MIFFSLLTDIVLIGLLIAGIAYAVKLTRQLAEMRAGRIEMERFVATFNATVSRAEAGIRGLKAASRDSGDDLERLIEKAQILRDELQFLTESADLIAARLTEKAQAVTKAQKPAATETPKAPVSRLQTPPAQTSSMEKDLMRVLKKSG